MRILVIEDGRKVAQEIREGLEAERYEVSVAHTGADGFFTLNEQTIDLVVLDLMLPGRGGLDVLSTMRERGLQTPVLILTARGRCSPATSGTRRPAPRPWTVSA